VAGFGDVRLEARGDDLIERISGLGTLVLRRLGGDRAGEIGAHRFLSSGRTSVEAIVDTLSARTCDAAQGLDIVCAQDTTEVNFGGSHGSRGGLGAGGNGKTPGFFVHGLVSIDATSERVLGLSGAHIWSREPGPVRPRWSRQPDNKESVRWLNGLLRAKHALAGAARITVVGDRESDIYHVLANCPQGVELIVRAHHNRKLVGEDDTHKALFETLADGPVQETIAVDVSPKGPGDKGRVASVELRQIKSVKTGDWRTGCPYNFSIKLLF
jgi:hypothetical protein